MESKSDNTSQLKELRDLLEETNNSLVAPEKQKAANHSKLIELLMLKLKQKKH